MLNDMHLEPGQFLACEPYLVIEGHEIACLADFLITVGSDRRIEAIAERPSIIGPTTNAHWQPVSEFGPHAHRTALWQAVVAYVESCPKLRDERDAAADAAGVEDDAAMGFDPDETPFVPIRINARVG